MKDAGKIRFLLLECNSRDYLWPLRKSRDLGDFLREKKLTIISGGVRSSSPFISPTAATFSLDMPGFLLLDIINFKLLLYFIFAIREYIIFLIVYFNIENRDNKSIFTDLDSTAGLQ